MAKEETFKVLWRAKTDNQVNESSPVVADYAQRALEDWQSFEMTGEPTCTHVWIHDDEAELHFTNVNELWLEPVEVHAHH